MALPRIISAPALMITLACFGLFAPAGALAQTALTQGVPVTIPSTTPNVNYTITLQQGAWNVVGITTIDDWDILHGGAGPWYGQGMAEYVLADGHAGTVTNNSGSVSLWNGTNVCDLQHAASAGTLVASQSQSATGTYSFRAIDVIVVWEVDIQAAGNYNVSVTGGTGLMWDFFTPQSSSTWIDIQSNNGSQGVGTPMTSVSLGTGFHLIVAYVNNGVGTTANLTATVQPAVPIFQATSVTAIGTPPISVVQGYTFQAGRAITNAGGATGSINYSIYLSSDTTIDTSDTLVYSGNTGAVNAGSTNTQTVTCTVPVATTPGNYYVGLYISPGTAGLVANTANADVTVNIPTPPGAFSLTAPADASTGVALTPTYTWNAATGVVSYTLQVSTASDFSTYLINQPGITTTTLAPAVTLSHYTVYYWQVIAVNAHGNTTSAGAPWSFTTIPAGPPPSAFTLIAPANSATGVTQYPEYSWNAATGADSYTLQVSTASNFATFVHNVTGLTTTSHAPTAFLNASTTYYWRVIANSTNGPTTSTGAPWSFTTAPPTAPPSAFNLSSPAMGATGVLVNPTYTWNAATGAVDYRLEVSPQSDFSFLLVNQSGIAATTATPSGNLASNSTYYWRVTAYNTGGWTTCIGAPWSFTTGTFTPQATSITVLNAPVRIPVGSTFQVNRSITNAGNVQGAIAYEVRISTDSTITSSDRFVFGGVTGTIAPSATDSNTVTCNVNSTTPIDTDWYVGLYINSSNTAVATAQIRTLPNYARFAASACTVSGSSFKPGDSANVGFTVANDGGASGPTGYTVYLSSDATIDLTDRQLATGTTGSLAADGGAESPSVAVTLPSDTSDGTWYIGVYLTASQTTAKTAVTSAIQVSRPSTSSGGSCARGAAGSGTPLALLPLLAFAALIALRRVI